jgi:hypothetical protein
VENALIHSFHFFMWAIYLSGGTSFKALQLELCFYATSKASTSCNGASRDQVILNTTNETRIETRAKCSRSPLTVGRWHELFLLARVYSPKLIHFRFKERKTKRTIVCCGDAVDEEKLILCCALCCTNCSCYPACDALGVSGKVRFLLHNVQGCFADSG